MEDLDGSPPPRDLSADDELDAEEKIAEARVWQYYVSGVYHDSSSRNNDSPIEVARSSIRKQEAGRGQLSFSSTPLNLYLPDSFYGYQLRSYNLTWRLVTVQIDSEVRNKKIYRRQRTSGRIV